MTMEANETEIVRSAAREIAMLNAEIAELMERRDLLKSHFKDGEVYKPGKYDFGDVELVVTTNQRISDTKAKQHLTLRELQAVSTAKVDAKKARAILPPEKLEKIMDKYDHRIEVKIK